MNLTEEEILAMDLLALEEQLKQQYDIRIEKGFIGIYDKNSNWLGEKLVMAELFGEEAKDIRKAALTVKREEERLRA